MRSRTLGSSGPDVSVVGLGCNNFGSRVNDEGTRAVVDAALDAGITLLDTADVYGDRGGSETRSGTRSRAGANGSCSRRSSATP